MMLLGIRADGDAGQETGMGHVYRSLAYARRIEQELPDASIRFFMRDFSEGLEKVRKESYPISVLPAEPTREDFQRAFQANPPHLVIIDTLGSSSDVIDAARQLGCGLVNLDDLEPSAAEADVIVNGIVWATRWLPEPFGRARVYQGVDYIQLRDQFGETNRQARAFSNSVDRILISTGGADGRGFALQLMKAVSELSFPCSVWVMAGPAYQNTGELQKAARTMSGRVQFSVVENAPNMADYLSASDLALITGGTVMFESAACGTPAVVACNYEHQVPQAQWFSEQGAALSLGYFSGQIDRQRVAAAIKDLAGDKARRQQMSDAGKATVDGKGLARFVEIVRSMLQTNRPELCRSNL